MSNFTEAQHNQAQSPVNFRMPTQAEIDHHLAVAHRMRAAATASLIRKIFSAPARALRSVSSAKNTTPHTA